MTTTMQKKISLLILLSLLFISLLSYYSTTALTRANCTFVGDTSVQQNNINNNYGTDTTIYHDDRTSYLNRGYWIFDNCAAATTATVYEAILFFNSGYIETGGNTLSFHFMNYTQPETVTTWNNQLCGTGFDTGTYCNLTAGASVAVTSTGWKSVNLTSIADRAIKLGINVSFASKTAEAGGAIDHLANLKSHDTAGTANDPYLEILYDVPAADTTVPVITFSQQSPADFNLSNVIGSAGVNISYIITDTSGVENFSAYLFYKTNSTQGDNDYIINGSVTSGYLSQFPSKNVTLNFTWVFFDNSILYGTYNLGESLFDSILHSSESLSSSSQYLSIELLNVSNKRHYGFFEVMANRTAGTGALKAIYCNSSYSFSSNPAVSANCAQFGTLTTNGYAHEHYDSFSHHNIFTFAPNTTTESLGNVKISEKSYFLLQGTSSTTFNYYYVNNVSRNDAMKTSSNNGAAWTSQAYTVDAHLHQFGTNQSFYYYLCVNDTLDNRNCSIGRQDFYDFVPLPPTAVNIYSPISQAYPDNESITIAYTESTSAANSAIWYYNISLYTTAEQFIANIVENNSLNLSFAWDVSSIEYGEYEIGVTSCNILKLCSVGFSANFSIYNSSIPIVPTVNVTPINWSGSGLYDYRECADSVQGQMFFWGAVALACFLIFLGLRTIGLIGVFGSFIMFYTGMNMLPCNDLISSSMMVFSAFLIIYFVFMKKLV